MIGKRALDDPRNALVYHFVRLVVELRAKYFVFENVRGLTVGSHKRFLEEIIQAFRAEGYQVVEDYRVLNAAHFGVPQDRQRLFLYGARQGLPLPAYPAPTHRPHKAGKRSGDLFEARTPTVWEALKDLPEADDFDELPERDWVAARFKPATGYVAALRCPETDSSNYGAERAYDPNLLTSSLRTVHTELSRRRFAATAHGDTEPVSRFLKLDPDGVSNTLRAGTASDRGAFTSPRPIHPYSPRCITVREAARLHSYPDWFRFHVTKWHGFRQIGNSVPPLLARAVAAQVREALDATPSRPSAAQSLGDHALLRLDMTEAASRYDVPASVIPKRTRPSERSTDVL
jgi:DNA (cytosine-5)-methyltransferase 1